MKKHQNKIIIFTIMLFILSGLMLGCKKDEESDIEGESYTATATGYSGDVTVKVTITGAGKINAIKADATKETPDIGGAAAQKIMKKIIETQSLAVDTVTGATITSNAVLTAAEVALKEAGLDTTALKNKK